MTMAAELELSTKFNNLSSKFSQLIVRTEDDKKNIHKFLDEINELDYRHPVITNDTKAVLLVHQCCTLIPPDDFELVAKCCRLFVNLIDHQHVTVGGQTLIMTIRWCLQALKQTEPSCCGEILIALNALLDSNLHHANTILLTVVYEDSPLLSLASDDRHPEVLVSVIHCLETCTSIPNNVKTKTNSRITPQLELCSKFFVKYLVESDTAKFDDTIWNKLLASSLRGLQNVIVQNAGFLTKELGLLLGICKSYMVYGVRDVQFVAPQKLTPSILSISEFPTNVPSEKKGGKIVKQRKHRIPNTKSDTEQKNKECVPGTSNHEVNNGSKASDSDFSETENGRAPNLHVVQSRVRQAALNTLLDIVKLTDKHTIFCYWLCFMPDGRLSNTNTLVVCFLKDPSPKVRMASLNVLLALLTRSKLYLAQAELNDKVKTYTPFSMVLGSSLRDLHKYLSLALNDNSIPVLMQALKCLAALVQATPYHKLPAGIITKIVRNVKISISHKDATVQVASLNVFGCLLAAEPPLPETKQALVKHTKSAKIIKANLRDRAEKEYAHFSSDEEEICVPGCRMDPPWLLERCLNNLGTSVNGRLSQTDEHMTATPVKLESLQVMSAMTRNYFDCFILPCRGHVIKTLSDCLLDKYTDLRLHTGRTIDFIGQAINQQLSRTDDGKFLKMEQGLVFWHMLLDNIIVAFIRNVEHSVLRAVGCDCLGSIGIHMYERFTREKQLTVITSLFSCTCDEEYSVRAASVRALGISVIYPSLRQDLGFVVDVADIILKALEDGNLGVRIKGSWSLGNISDALILNKTDENIEDIADDVLLRLLQIGIKVSSDNDKIKVNAVRALGNLLQLASVNFREVIDEAIEVLVKNATTGTNMKVRWNACYAIGNVLKNSELYLNNDLRRNKLFSTLLNLIDNFPNFKVRINAALALSCPDHREAYGKYFNVIWDSLLKALENTQNIEDFNEYNHRDHLIEQICITLAFLMTSLKKSDLLGVQETLLLHFDLLKLQMRRVTERIVPGRTSVFLCAASYAKNHAMDKTLSNQQKETISMLSTVFSNE